jgi:uncharacterized RDD family membrane protein YckC
MTSIKYCPKCGNEIEKNTEESLPELCANCGLNFSERERQIRELKSEKWVGEERYADFFQRLAAFFIDSLIISFLSWCVMSLIHIPIVLSDPIGFYSSFYYFWIAMFFNWVLGFFYCCLLEAYRDGQTLGKRVLRIRTVDETSFEIAEPKQYAITNILKTSPFLLVDFLVGFLISDRDSNKTLRFLQHLSKTVVIVIKK